MRFTVEFDVPDSGDDSAQGFEIARVLRSLADEMGRAAYVYADDGIYPVTIDGTDTGCWTTRDISGTEEDGIWTSLFPPEETP